MNYRYAELYFFFSLKCSLVFFQFCISACHSEQNKRIFFLSLPKRSIRSNPQNFWELQIYIEDFSKEATKITAREFFLVAPYFYFQSNEIILKYSWHEYLPYFLITFLLFQRSWFLSATICKMKQDRGTWFPHMSFFI